MLVDFRGSLLSLLVVFSLSVGLAQAQQTQHTRIIPLSVLDHRGWFTLGIKSQQVRIRGEPFKLHGLGLDTDPRRVILLLDTSGSMGPPKSTSWENATRITKAFLAAVQKDDWISLHVFADKDEVLVPLTQDFQLVIRKVEAFSGSGRGRTRLAKALSEVVQGLKSELRFGDAVVLISDGKYSSEDSGMLSKLAPEFVQLGLRLFLLRTVSPNWDGGQRDVSDARDFVNETGGLEFHPLSPIFLPGQLFQTPLDEEWMRGAAEATYRLVRNVYRVELEVSSIITKCRKLSVQLLDETGHKAKGLEPIYPSYVCPVPAQP